jgi:hypothetical protein
MRFNRKQIEKTRQDGINQGKKYARRRFIGGLLLGCIFGIVGHWAFLTYNTEINAAFNKSCDYISKEWSYLHSPSSEKTSNWCDLGQSNLPPEEQDGVGANNTK